MRQTLLAYFGLAVLIFCFASIGAWFVPEGSSFFLDFQSLIGSFGCLQFPNGTEVCDVTLKHGTGAKAGFIYCLGDVEDSLGDFLQKYYAERAIFS